MRVSIRNSKKLPSGSSYVSQMWSRWCAISCEWFR
eukprot:COSAG02_NODE_317_length_24808_cov_120.564329_27_plen_35_part_00